MIFLSCSLNDSKISGLLTDGLQPRTSPSPAARHELRGGRDSGAGAGTSGQAAMAIRMPRQGKTVGVAFPIYGNCPMEIYSANSYTMLYYIYIMIIELKLL